MSAPLSSSLGAWRTTRVPPAFQPAAIVAALQRFREPMAVVRDPSTGRVGVALEGAYAPGNLDSPGADGVAVWPLLALLPGIYPEWLGDRSFNEVHRVRFPYIAGAMANGIATEDIVIRMGQAGMLGFFGAAGLPPQRVEQAIGRVQAALGEQHPYGFNLIHSPNEPDLEEAVVALYLRAGVPRVSAAAYMGLTPYVVRYAASGLRQDPSGRIVRRNHVFAKISRPEVAGRFMGPPPKELLDALVARGQLSAEEARLALRVPVAEDITVESDSGGHTDNRPLGSLFPVIAALRDRTMAEHGFTRPIRVGAAGGLGTPGAVAAAFGLGAAYVLTGSVNQSAVESGLSEAGKVMLAQAGLADVIMAPSADMFELGVKVQVLRRGTMFGTRALRLHDLYTSHASLEAIPAADRTRLEREILGRPVEEVWAETSAYFQRRDPSQLERAARDPKHRMALVFRWYLGQSSRWAIAGVPERRLDYQIWCGPAMGAFNDWAAGSFLADAQNRSVVQIALNLLEGAASITRAQQLRACGVPVPPAGFAFRPRPLSTPSA